MTSSVSRILLGGGRLPLVALAAGVQLVSAEIQLPKVFSDHLVLQRDTELPIWGRADPGEKVTVSFATQSQTVTAGADGHWAVKLKAMAASGQPRELLVTGRNSMVKLTDVLVGEVWLGGGQSNMRSPLFAAHDAAEAVPAAGDNQLRLFNVGFKTAYEPQPTVLGEWKLSTPETARDFSAVGYFFARELRRVLGCPVGILCAAWGGTPIQTWISLQGIRTSPPLTRPLGEWEKAVEAYQKVQTDPKLAADYAAELQRWKKEVEPVFNAAMKAYNAGKAAGQPLGEKPSPAWPEPQNPDPMGMPSPSRRPQTPAVSFNGMIAPLAPFAVRGVIWYQGEANGGAGMEYRVLFPRLIQDWRARWGSDFPFLFVQLPGWGTDSGPVAESGWPWTREAQLMALREPRTGMAVTIDVGDPNNVHPADKRDVGYRLALLARRQVYGENLVACGPLYRDCAVTGGGIRIRFDQIGGGLRIGQAPWRAPGVEPFPTDRLFGFYVAGDDRKWVAAAARIDGDTVLVSSPAVPQPSAVRYGWASFPQCNLYNREGLPASPFRTDSWPK